MGWELLNVDEAVDLRDFDTISSLHKIPIGNYADDIINLR
jgi:hypothetical protein